MEEITGDRDFHVKLIHAMQDAPIKHKEQYKKEWDKTLNKLEKEFGNTFLTDTGAIDWEKLVRFVSDIPDKKKKRPDS